MLTKRQKIAISSVLLAAGIFFLPLVEPPNRFYLLAVVIFASYLLSVWSIFGEFTPVELVSLFVLPVILTASFGLYQAQFETTTLVRLILVATYVATMYTILLSENIFNVCLERNIPLVRAARTVGYLATLFVAFAFFTLLFGLRLNGFLFATVSAVVAAFLFAQGLWQIELKETNLGALGYFSFVAGLIIGEVSLVLSFWPLEPPKIGLAIAATVYVVLGILQHHLRNDLKSRTLLEYLFVGAAVVFLLAISTSWGV